MCCLRDVNSEDVGEEQYTYISEDPKDNKYQLGTIIYPIILYILLCDFLLHRCDSILGCVPVVSAILC